MAAAAGVWSRFINSAAGINVFPVKINHIMPIVGPKTIFFWAPAFKWVSYEYTINATRNFLRRLSLVLCGPTLDARVTTVIYSVLPAGVSI